MAIARFSVSVGLKKDGTKTSAVAHASYAMGLKQYAKKSDEIEYTKNHLPEWADNDPLKFWQLAEQNERANANIYKEHIISLPRELTLEQNIAFIDDWIEKEFKGQHYYNYAIHNPKARDGLSQPHCHLMFCERINDGIERTSEQYFKRYNSKNPKKGGAKKANTGLTQAQLKQNLIEQRKRYGEVLQHHLNLAGVEYVVDMRNWKERGLDEPPIVESFDDIQTQKRLMAELDRNPINQEIERKIEDEYYNSLPSLYEMIQQSIYEDCARQKQYQNIDVDVEEQLAEIERQEREQQRLEQQRQEQQRLERERQEQERLEQERQERERLEREQKTKEMTKLYIDYQALLEIQKNIEQEIIGSLDVRREDGRLNPLKAFDEEIEYSRYYELKITHPQLIADLEKDLQEINPSYVDYVRNGGSNIMGKLTHDEKLKYANSLQERGFIKLENMNAYKENKTTMNNIAKSYTALKNEGIMPDVEFIKNQRLERERQEQERLEQERLDLERERQTQIEREQPQAQQQQQNRPRFSP